MPITTSYPVELTEPDYRPLPELVDGALSGLVLAEQVRRSFPPSTGFEPFAAGFARIPIG